MVTVGRNTNQKKLINKYLGSLARQNYSNYRAIYVDDLSEDNSVDMIEELVFSEYPEIKDKLTVVRNTEKLNSLGSFHKAVISYCQAG